MLPLWSTNGAASEVFIERRLIRCFTSITTDGMKVIRSGLNPRYASGKRKGQRGSRRPSRRIGQVERGQAPFLTVSMMVFRLHLVSFSLLALCSCGANEQILRSGKDSPSPANVGSPKSTLDQEIEAMRTADFRYIWVLRRKDGAVLDAADKTAIRGNTVDMNRRVLADEDRALIIGSNVVPFKENFEVLAARFDVQDFSTEPVPGPLPTRQPTPKLPRNKQGNSIYR